MSNFVPLQLLKSVEFDTGETITCEKNLYKGELMLLPS